MGSSGFTLVSQERDELESARLRRTVDQLQEALDARIVIEQAKGVLAERHDISVDEAFELLRYAARTSGRNLRALAAEVVERKPPLPSITVARARSARLRAASQREQAEALREHASDQAARSRKITRRIEQRTGDWACRCGHVYRVLATADEVRLWPRNSNEGFAQRAVGATCFCGEPISRGTVLSALFGAAASVAAR